MASSGISSVRNYCDRCLGRIFSNISTGLTNSQRGLIVRASFNTFLGEVLDFTGNCEICANVFDNLERYCEMCQEKVKEFDFRTFRIGSVFPESIILNEKSVHENLGVTGETVKKEFNRELGKLFSMQTGVEYDSDNPEMDIVVDTRYDSIRIRSESVYLYGTYRKTVRGIPQTRWIHGSGDTVESIIGEPLRGILQGENFFLHGAGREDVDVRMLGNGREFIVEISSPKKRDFNVTEYRKKVNASRMVSIHNLAVTSKSRVKELKLSRNDKTYVILLEATKTIDRDRLRKSVESLNGKVIYQRTPLRVSRRRADLVRERRLLESSLISARGNTARVRIKAEAGTYIKELVSGDHDRTKPSIASEYGEKLKVKELDVTRIHR